MRGVLLAPGARGVIPASARQFGGAIDAIPVRRVMAGEVLQSPGNAHFAEHGEIGGGICAVGIEERAVPVEEDALDLAVWCGAHSGTGQISRREGRAGGSAKCEGHAETDVEMSREGA